MSKADVAARAITDRLAPGSALVDVEKVAVDLGVAVVRQDTDQAVDAMLIRRDGRVAIGLNGARPVVTQRFTLAHMIGHYRMHARRDLLLDGLLRRRHARLSSIPTDREEAEANRFAGALLVPEKAAREAAVRADCSTGADLVDALAGEFQVSRLVMGYRLVLLGVIIDA
ncbi:ImmA/IrrE family metallo-endopeptidase [Streptomyces bacillaris]|uniref:ImmA/IrrE family metallo-endopeptidase n=1 Tax=Streptomyces bacillaris TaxID=68179 RepID=UPI003D74785E